MPFARWYPLADASQSAPAEPGLFQVRLRAGLIDYPRGKSAMVHYELAQDVRVAAIAFLSDHAGRDWLCRHTVELSRQEADDLAAMYDRLLRAFRTRFGAAPSIPMAADTVSE